MAARFECTTHAARQILAVLRREGLADRIRINPEGELDDSDRIQVLRQDGELSGNALYCSPSLFIVENADGEMVARGPAWSLEDMVESFLNRVREELLPAPTA